MQPSAAVLWMPHLFRFHHTPRRRCLSQTPIYSYLSIWQTIPYPNDVVVNGNAGDCVCVCVCVCEWNTLGIPLPGLNCWMDCNSRCKRLGEKVREILLDGHRNSFSLDKFGFMVHKIDTLL